MTVEQALDEIQGDFDVFDENLVKAAALAVICQHITQQAATIKRLRDLLAARESRLRMHEATGEGGYETPYWIERWESDPDHIAVVIALRDTDAGSEEG